jgi:hypothetical protein
MKAMSAKWLATAESTLRLFFIFNEAASMDERPVVTDSKQRVTLELMQIIVDSEGKAKYEKPDARTYYLTLYSQCLKVVSGEMAANSFARS